MSDEKLDQIIALLTEIRDHCHPSVETKPHRPPVEVHQPIATELEARIKELQERLRRDREGETIRAHDVAVAGKSGDERK